mmetsp:Transcript_37810/g.92018  ORF Transcript_37810/g.92018 Transcript_37810/m.92018 type:complete len:114 (+) Transcript_37810:1398-1739(+)
MVVGLGSGIRPPPRQILQKMVGSVGAADDGENDGLSVGTEFGEAVTGLGVGCSVVGAGVGREEGRGVGLELGVLVGLSVGATDGSGVGNNVGEEVGNGVGTPVHQHGSSGDVT